MCRISLIFLGLLSYIAAEEFEAETSIGKIKGSTLTSRLGKTIYAFRGIRYAEPPVGDLRFQAPVLAKKWEGVYDATKDGPACPQVTEVPTSEDCLLLNIYTTEKPSTSSTSKLPVVVFLHPGAFLAGNGRSTFLGPQYMLDAKVMLVTINYRLGTLGFLSVGKESPGNNGLKDQVAALRWVKDNIEAFGGDPTSVSLYGNSAGAYSALLHMVSPMSKGLFNSVMASSGFSVGNYKLPKNQLGLAKEQAKLLKCSYSTNKEIVDCLRTKSAEDLGNSVTQLREMYGNPILLWLPVIEEDFGQERFLTDDPWKLLKEGKFENVPIVGGSTENELAANAYKALHNQTILDKLNNNFEEYAPTVFSYDKEVEKSRKISKILRNFYFKGRKINNETFQNLIELYSDSIINYPSEKALSYVAARSTKPVYVWNFIYYANNSHFIVPETGKPLGAVHGDDLMYTMYTSTFPLFNSSYPQETRMINSLMFLGELFCRTGKFDDEGVPKALDGANWPKFNPLTREYLEMGVKAVAKKNLNAERYALWEKLFP